MTINTLLPSAVRLSLGGAVLVGFVSFATAKAADDKTPVAAEKAATLPLTASFEKAPPGEDGGPYALKLKNTSSAAVTVSATVDLSVASHNRAKTRQVAAMTIEAGKVGTIADLGAHDKVTLTADGYPPMVIVVPEKAGTKG